MSITKDFISMFKNINKILSFPSIQEIYFPPSEETDKNSKNANFGMVILQDGSIGIVYIKLIPNLNEIIRTHEITSLEEQKPLDLISLFDSTEIFEKTIAMGVINAVSQYIFKKIEFSFDFTTDSMGLLNISKSDKVGMVGFFPPLVKKIERMNIALTVIEKRKSLVQDNSNWEVTLNPEKLKSCNKILCTSTTVLNDSIDSILENCKNAEKISIIGPTAGFLPDPLFKRGVDVIGGTYITDSSLFRKLIRANRKWGPSTEKFCLEKAKYRGYDELVHKITKNH